LREARTAQSLAGFDPSVSALLGELERAAKPSNDRRRVEADGVERGDLHMLATTPVVPAARGARQLFQESSPACHPVLRTVSNRCPKKRACEMRSVAVLVLTLAACCGAEQMAAAATGPASFPLKLAPGKRYLVDQNDRPFSILGEAAWSLIAGLADADVDRYLEDRRQKGFNTVLVNLLEHFFVSNPPNNAYGVGPFTTPGDFSTPNEPYFAFADTVIRKAAAKGILVLLTPAYLGYPASGHGWSTEMAQNGVTKLKSYGNYLGNRYRTQPNILWVNAGDSPTPDKSLVDAVATGIRMVDTVHLQTAHAYEGYSALSFFGSYSWLDVDSIYQQAPSINLAATSEYNLATHKPFFLIESFYENEHNTTNKTVRQEAYEPLLGGGMGQIFGNRPIWLFDTGWQDALNSQGSRDMQSLHALFGARRWDLLVPDQTSSFLTAGWSSGTDRASAARASDGSWGLAYLPSSRNITVDLSGFSGAVRASWFDPTSGILSPVPGSPFINTGSRSLNSPATNGAGDSDWVLVLETAPPVPWAGPQTAAAMGILLLGAALLEIRRQRAADLV
jgi:hypothetical protein